MRVFIHIGYAKTGTTWLQRHIFQAHTEISYVLPYYFVHSEIIEPDAFSYDPEKARSAIEGKGIQRSGQRSVLGISYERLAGNPYYDGVSDGRTIADRIKSTFPDAKIVVGIRNQIGIIESMYKEYIASGGICKFHDYISPRLDQSRIPPRFSWDFLKYDRLITYYQSLFGREHVHVQLFEDFASDMRSFLEALYAFLEIEPYWPESAYDRREHGTLSSNALLTLLRLTNYCFSGGFRPSGPIPRKNPLCFRLQKYDRPIQSIFHKKFEIPPNIRIQLENECRDSNLRLFEITGLDLQARGYPM